MIFPNIQAPSHHYRKKITSFFFTMKHMKHVKHLKHHNTHGPKKANELRDKDSATGATMPTPMQQAADAWNKIVLVGEFAGEFYSYESDFIFGVFCT